MGRHQVWCPFWSIESFRLGEDRSRTATGPRRKAVPPTHRPPPCPGPQGYASPSSRQPLLGPHSYPAASPDRTCLRPPRPPWPAAPPPRWPGPGSRGATTAWAGREKASRVVTQHWGGHARWPHSGCSAHWSNGNRIPIRGFSLAKGGGGGRRAGRLLCTLVQQRK